MRMSIFVVTGLLLLGSLGHAAKGSGPGEVPDIRTLPRLTKGLPAGTIAWATVNQVHPAQPQTGKREVRYKLKRFQTMLPDHPHKFPKELYEYLYKFASSPVYIGPTPSNDFRAGAVSVLGYVTDGTHDTEGLGNMIVERFGEEGLSKAQFDEKGRPLNFILVKVLADQSNLSPEEFAQFMEKGNLTYLKRWERAADGQTRIESIGFFDLPETVMQTTDNPYRGLVGKIQRDGKLGKIETPFSQFIAAEHLVPAVDWDEISLEATTKAYEKAQERAEKVVKSLGKAIWQPVPADLKPRACGAIF